MSLPYFPLFPTDFEADTSHLTLAEDGAYNRLLRLCWMTPGCSLPNDEAWILRRMRARTDDEIAAVRTVLEEFFSVKNGRVSNARLTREFVAANEAHEKRKKAGSKGGSAKALKTNKTQPSNAVAKPKQPEPEPEPLRVSSNEDAEAAFSLWNEAAENYGWPKVQKVTPARRKALQARLKEFGGLHGWREMLARAGPSDFLRDGNFFAFDWVVKPANLTKVLEGNYDNRPHQPAPNRSSKPNPGGAIFAGFGQVAHQGSSGSPGPHGPMRDVTPSGPDGMDDGGDCHPLGSFLRVASQ